MISATHSFRKLRTEIKGNQPSGLSGSCFVENGNCPPSSGGVDVGVPSDELMPVEPGELAAHNLGDDGTVLGVELTTATLASKALALELGELHLSLCIVAGSDAVTDGGVTDGGVSGERRFIWHVGVVAGIRGAGREMNVGGCSSETAANFEEVALPSEERLLLFEIMTSVDRCAKKINDVIQLGLFLSEEEQAFQSTRCIDPINGESREAEDCPRGCDYLFRGKINQAGRSRYCVLFYSFETFVQVLEGVPGLGVEGSW